MPSRGKLTTAQRSLQQNARAPVRLHRLVSLRKIIGLSSTPVASCRERCPLLLRRRLLRGIRH